MSFDRRWLLTTAGAAFLASIARDGLAAAPLTAPKPTGDAAKDKELLFTEFERGFGMLDPAQTQLCRGILTGVYGDRFDDAYPGLDATKRQLLLGFAYGLGNLTYRCLENERKGACGWRANPKAVLREEHVQRARELLGYHLNSSIRIDCGNAKAAVRIRQVDEPCPLCLG